MHFKVPIIHRVKLFNAQLIEYTIAKDIILKENKEIMGDEIINAVTADNKFMAVEATVLIKLDTDLANIIKAKKNQYIKFENIDTILRQFIKS